MKTLITFICLIISVSYCYSQSGTIQGKITDKTAKQIAPVPYAHVVLFNKKSVAVDSVYTDFEGNYKINLPKGKYNIKIDFLGFLPYSSEIIKLKDNEIKNINISLEPTSVPVNMNVISHPFPTNPKQEKNK